MATVRQQRERLEALMTAAPGISSIIDRYKDDNITLKDDELPGVIVYRAGRAEHDIGTKSDYFSSRLWLIWVVVQEITNMNPQSKRDADDAAEDLIDPLINYLKQHRELGLEGVDDRLDGVQGITLKDDGVKEYQRAAKRYSAVPILVYVGNTTDTWSEE